MMMPEPYDDDDCNHLTNLLAIKMGAAVDLLNRLRKEGDRDFGERNILASAEGFIESHLNDLRERVAQQVVPWFEAQQFDIGDIA